MTLVNQSLVSQSGACYNPGGARGGVGRQGGGGGGGEEREELGGSVYSLLMCVDYHHIKSHWTGGL